MYKKDKKEEKKTCQII